MAHSFGAIPSSSRSNSSVVAWFMASASDLAPRRPRGSFRFECLGIAGVFIAVPLVALATVAARHWLEWRGHDADVATLETTSP